MPAALRVDLVLEMQTGYAVVLEDRDRAGRAHGFTESGVRVDERRKSVTRAICLLWPTTSVKVVSPMSGSANPAEYAPPET